MDDRDRDRPDPIHHTVLRVHRDRIEEVAALWHRLEQGLRGGDDDAVALVHRDAWNAACRWKRADQAHELQDRTHVEAATLARWREAAARLRPDWNDEADALAAALDRLPVTVPRACVVVLDRSLARLGRLIDLQAPGFAIENEPVIALRVIEEMHLETVPHDPEPDMQEMQDAGPRAREDAFANLLYDLLDACMISHAPRSGVLDVGLGAAVMRVPAFAAAVGGRPRHELEAEWRLDRQHIEVWMHPSVLPRAHLLELEPAAIRLACGLGDAGPVAWATGDDLVAYAAQIRGLAGADRLLATESVRLADVLTEISSAGEGVLSWLEYQHPEAEGQRPFFAFEPPE